MNGYRFVFEDLEHRNNYTPPLVIDPRRINSPTFATDKGKCSGYALSMFNEVGKARQKYAKIAKNFKNIHKVLGGHIAEFSIEESDGKVSPPNHEGHFDLHEFEDADFTTRVRLICPAQ